MTDVSVKSHSFISLRRWLVWLALALLIGAAAWLVAPRRLPAVAGLLALAYIINGLAGQTRDEDVASPHREQDRSKNQALNQGRLDQAADDARHVSRQVELLTKRNEELVALYSLADTVGSSLELREVLSVALGRIIQIFEAIAGEIAVSGAPEENLVVYCRGQRILASYRGMTAPRLNRGLASRVLKTGQPVITEVQKDFAVPSDALEHLVGVNRIVIFPLKSKSQTVGTISLACPPNLPVTAADQEFLLSIGSIAGTAVDNSRLYHRLKRLSDTDPVTGLYNHRFIIKRLFSELNRASRYDHPMSLLMVDIDKFKQLNDNFGHPFGDMALKKIALAIVAACRQTDFVGRYGGDEFLVVLPETGGDEAAVVSDRARRHIQSVHLFPKNAADVDTIKLSASFGLAVFPEAGRTGKDLIAAADKNLYAAKRAGGDQTAGKAA